MNKVRRNKNRNTAASLSRAVSMCPECGERGPHWVSFPMLSGLLANFFEGEEGGFWTCSKFYDSTGRRIIS